MLSKFSHVKISAIKTVVPSDFIDIDSEVEFYGNNPNKLNRLKKTVGFNRRHIADENTTTADLAYCAALKLIDEFNINKEEIDTLLFLTQTRDYVLPANANLLHGKLKLSENCSALDISQGCSGYVYALWLAHSLISSGACKKILLLSGDTLSKVSYKENRLTAPIFGDSATATLLEYDSENKNAYFDTGSKGEGWDKIIIPAGGARIPVDEEVLKTDLIDPDNNRWNLSHILMNGLDVFNFTMVYAVKSAENLLNFAQKSKDEVSLCAMHQANKQIVETITRKLGLDPEKTPYNTFSDYGNNACNSVATVLSQNLNENNGNNVLLCSFGVGLSYASAWLDLSKTKNFGISVYDMKNTFKEDFGYWKNLFTNKGEE